MTTSELFPSTRASTEESRLKWEFMARVAVFLNYILPG
jgi:hypothetical protein